MELKPCPFCGGKDLYSSANYVQCAKCFMTGGFDPTSGLSTPEAWNQRVKKEEPKEKITMISSMAGFEGPTTFALPCFYALTNKGSIYKYQGRGANWTQITLPDGLDQRSCSTCKYSMRRNQWMTHCKMLPSLELNSDKEAGEFYCAKWEKKNEKA